MKHTTPPTNTLVAFAIGCALTLITATGCKTAHVHAAPAVEPAPRPTVHVLIDRSHSTDAARNSQLAAAKKIHLTMASTADIHFWAYDSTAVEVIAAGSALTSKQLVIALGGEISPKSAAVRTITRPGAAIKAVADKASSGAPLSVIVITDGDIDDAADRPVLKAAAENLIGKTPGSKLTVIGIDPNNRKVWEDILTPAAAQATTLATWAEASSALKVATKS